MLGVLNEAKKCSKRKPVSLWKEANKRFVHNGVLCADSEMITDFVADACLHARLSCPECAGRLRSLKITFSYSKQIRRLFECRRCDGIYYIVVQDDAAPWRRWDDEEN